MAQGQIIAQYISLNSKMFIELSRNGRKIGKPILPSHYWAIRNENDLEETHQFLENLTPEQWDAMHLYGILDWRNHEIAR